MAEAGRYDNFISHFCKNYSIVGQFVSIYRTINNNEGAGTESARWEVVLKRPEMG
jgi:hypothetical protein